MITLSLVSTSAFLAFLAKALTDLLFDGPRVSRRTISVISTYLKQEKELELKVALNVKKAIHRGSCSPPLAIGSLMVVREKEEDGLSTVRWT